MRLVRARKHGFARTGKGKRPSEYTIWKGLRQRCLNPKAPNFHLYGGRGITVSKEWKSFGAFLRDMGPRPSKRYQVERLDNDGPYAAGNCKWATQKEQARNRRSNLLLTHDGKTRTAQDWAEFLGVNGQALRWRIQHGWSHGDALTIPFRKIGQRGQHYRRVK